MSDLKKTIEWFEYDYLPRVGAYRKDCKLGCNACMPKHEGENYCDIDMLCKVLDLLLEQEPKQIVRKQVKKEHEDGSIDYFAEWYCPHCNSLILRGFRNPSIKFCYKCGKPILWEGQ